MTELSIEPVGWCDYMGGGQADSGFVGIARVAGSAAMVNHVSNMLIETFCYLIVYLSLQFRLLLMVRFIECPGVHVSVRERCAAYG